MRSLFVVTLICFAGMSSQSTLAAEATSKGTYVVPTAHQRLVSWYDLNRHNVYKGGERPDHQTSRQE